MVTTESWPQQVEDLEKSSYSSSVRPSRPGKLDKLNCPSHRSSSISGLSPVHKVILVAKATLAKAWKGK